jgi:hypothetical protein
MILDISLTDKIIETDIFEAAAQELDIIFSTVNTELIGYPEFGCNFEEFLWMLTPSVTSLQHYIENKLRETTFISSLNFTVNIVYSKSDTSYESVYNILITLYDNNKSIQKEITLGQ